MTNTKITRFVLQREDGKFYWKGQSSSSYGWKDGLENAFIFKSEQGARSRIFTCDDYKCEIKKVKITLCD